MKWRGQWLPRAEVVALKVLRAGQWLYGLEMVAISQGELKRGSCYVFLMRLEERGWVRTRDESPPPVGRLPRRQYQITDAGIEAHDGIAALCGGQIP